jgi:hypothetical protein
MPPERMSIMVNF